MSLFGKVVLIAAIVVTAGVLIGYLGVRSTPVVIQSPTATSAAAVSTQAVAPVVPPVNEPFMANNYRPLTSTSAELSEASAEVVGLITNWEARLDQILEADTDEKQKAQEMLAVFPKLSAEGQEEFAQHLSNLVLDEDYPALAQYLTNSALPEPVLDVLLSDALNRPNAQKLPAMLNIARDPRHPKASEARDLLELYLEEDYGSDWATWEKELDKWLQENPD